jgi:hypothetical protein
MGGCLSHIQKTDPERHTSYFCQLYFYLNYGKLVTFFIPLNKELMHKIISYYFPIFKT